MDDRCGSALRRSSGADYPRNFCRASGRVSNDLSVLMPFGQRRETALRLKEASANEDEMSTTQSVESTGESPCDLPDLVALGTAGDRERPTQLTPAGVRLRTPGVASFLPVLLQS
ncbi:unnamed protein product [Arctogadus glacialis]